MSAISTKIEDKMAKQIVQIVVLMHVLHNYGYCQPTVETSGRAFVQTDNNELRYMVDGVHLSIPGNTKDMRRWEDTATNPVIFEPPFVDFEEQPVGMPHLEQITVRNADLQNSLHLVSISGSTPHFHCSFFHEKHVPPGGNTTFDVVFLARQVGNVENTLNIHTSVGTFQYQVFGVGIANPYRVRPLLGAKVAINTSFSPLILLHNPHSSTLQVEEVYSSGGDLHLQLPSGEPEAAQHLWEIPPYDTKPIMKASFLGRIENNHTAFIRIKTNKDSRENILVLPVEVEVNSDPGMFSTLDKLDFGIVRSSDPPKTLPLNLFSSRVDPLPIHEIYVSPPNDAIQIHFHPTYLKPDLWESSTIATVSFNASRVKHVKHTSGVIIVKSKTESHQHIIPYQATVYHGSIFYDKNKTTFFTGQANRTISRNLPITNLFNFSLAIYNVSISDDKAAYFTIDQFQGPLVIRKGDTKIPFMLHFHMNETNMSFKTLLRLHTNASVFYLPINVYNGKLNVVFHRPEIFRGQMDFGTLNLDSAYWMLVTVRNPNPVNVIVREYASNLNRSHLELLGMEKGNATMLTRYHDTSLIPSPLTIPPDHYAVFNLSIVTRDYEGTFVGESIFYTHFENLYVPITYRTAEGSLNPPSKILVLDNCFPTKPCQQHFSLDSSFETYMVLREITFQPNDTRFYYSPHTEEELLLEPQKNIYLGTIGFDPQRGASGCTHDCYAGLATYITAGHEWLQGMSLEVQTTDVDQFLFTRAKHKWHTIQQQHGDVVNVTIQVDTDQARGFLYHAQAHLSWPRIVREKRLTFPLTQIGNASVEPLVLENPSDSPVLVQLLPLGIYPNPQTILDQVAENITADLNSILDSNSPFAFSLQDLRHHSPKHNLTTKHRRRIEKLYNVHTHPESLVYTLEASSSLKVNVAFLPKDDSPQTSLLVIRNNLTILEAVVLQGSGGRGDMRFGNKKPGSALVFEMGDKSCDRKKSSKGNIDFTVKNKFTAKNTGQLPFFIKNFSINDRQCEGYGFKVLECEGFELAPNASKVVTIAFTPDFSMSRIQRTLTLHTSLGPAINYTLQATVPPHLLTKCSAALPRPTWEPLLYYSIVCIMGFVLFCIFAAAYFEAERIYSAEKIRARVHAMFDSQGYIDRSKVFDLNNLTGGDKVLASNGSSASSPSSHYTNHRTNSVPNGAHKSSDTTEQRHVETITPSGVQRPASARKRRGGGGGANINISKICFSFLAQCFKVIVCYVKVPFQISLFKPTTKSDASKNNAVSTDNKSEKESKSSNTSTTKNSEKADPSHTILRRMSSSDRDEENYSARNSSSRKSVNNRTTAKRPFPDLIESVMCSNEQNMKNRNEKNRADVFGNNIKNNKLSGSKKYDPYGIDSTESRSQTSTPEIDYDETPLRGKPGRKLRLQTSGSMYEARRSQEMDDNSSTTTESSVEVEDKSSTHDSTPEPVPPKSKRPRSKNKSKKDSPITANAASLDDSHGDYIVGSRNKLHKKGNGDFGGNILRPSSLELPYKLEGDSPKPGLKASDLSPHAHVGRRATKNRNKKGKKLVSSTPTFNYNQLDDCTMSPPTLWDQPLPLPLNDDLSDLALQTQIFAQRAVGRSMSSSGAMTGNNTGLNEQLSNSSRSSSYSSVVSSGSDNKMNGKISAFSPVNVDARAPGGMLGSSTSPGTSKKKPAWSGSALGQESQLSPSLGSSLAPITETSSPLASGFNLSPGPAPMFTGQHSPSQLQPTMMQQLQAERRQRILEHEQRRMNQDNWPFMDQVLPAENLWNAGAGDWFPSSGGATSTGSIWNPTSGASLTTSASPATSGWVTESAATPGGSSIWGAPGEESIRALDGGAAPNAFSPFHYLWNQSSLGMQGDSVRPSWPSFSPPKPDGN